MSFDSTSFAHSPEGKGIPALFERWMLDELAWDLKGAVERFEGAGKAKVCFANAVKPEVTPLADFPLRGL